MALARRRRPGPSVNRTAELAARAASVIDCGRPHADGGGQEIGGSPFVLGANYRMSELQSALANVGLSRFPEQARQREEMGDYMDEALSEIPGIRLLKRDPRHTTRSFYRYIFAIDPAGPSGAGVRAGRFSAGLEGR